MHLSATPFASTKQLSLARVLEGEQNESFRYAPDAQFFWEKLNAKSVITDRCPRTNGTYPLTFEWDSGRFEL